MIRTPGTIAAQAIDAKAATSAVALALSGITTLQCVETALATSRRARAALAANEAAIRIWLSEERARVRQLEAERRQSDRHNVVVMAQRMRLSA
jgi:hypothetical protein